MIDLRRLVVLLVAPLFGVPGSASAAPEIALAPLRAVVDADAPRATFRVANPTDRILEARIRWIDLAATADGYRHATARERARLSASPFLVLRPAFVRLEPGKSAEIEVALKKGARIPAGERRSHLLIEVDAVRSPLRRIGGLEVDIGLSVTAPVLLRGRGEAAARIADTSFTRTPDGLLELVAAVEPRGEHSAYGRLVARFAEPGGAARTLGEVRNVAALTDAGRRVYTIRLDTPRLPAGALTIAYVGQEEYEGRVFATRAFSVAAPADAVSGR